jgi:hypothetical protein
MPTHEQGIQAAFTSRAETCGDATVIAETAASIWIEVGAVLSPIIGQSGVAALFKRSIQLTQHAHPSLEAVLDDSPQSAEPAHLQAVLARLTPADALAANAALLQTFENLLATLIDTTLTKRLLHSVGNHPSSGNVMKDIAP